VGELTEKTKVIISFGARNGGFEFAKMLREAVYGHFNRDIRDVSEAGFCYLDAKSLIKEKATTTPWVGSIGLYKMQNPHWKIFYRTSMKNASTMIFLLTDTWLRSGFCWQELGWHSELIQSGVDLKTIFVVFPSARLLLAQRRFITTGPGQKQNPDALLANIWRSPKVASIDIDSTEYQRDEYVSDPSGNQSRWTRTHLTKPEFDKWNRILGEIVIK
jgi:hypothetical protein